MKTQPGFVLVNKITGKRSPFFDCLRGKGGEYREPKRHQARILKWIARQRDPQNWDRNDVITEINLFWERREEFRTTYGDLEWLLVSNISPAIRGLIFAALWLKARPNRNKISKREMVDRLLAVHWLAFDQDSDPKLIGATNSKFNPPNYRSEKTIESEFVNDGWGGYKSVVASLKQEDSCRRVVGYLLSDHGKKLAYERIKQELGPNLKGDISLKKTLQDGFDWRKTILKVWEIRQQVVSDKAPIIDGSEPNGGMPVDDVHKLTRSKIYEGKINPSATDPSEIRQITNSYSVAELMEMTNLGNTSLNKYAKHAGVETPERGKKNHRYSTADAVTILEVILKHASYKKVKMRCKTSLISLQNHF